MTNPQLSTRILELQEVTAEVKASCRVVFGADLLGGNLRRDDGEANKVLAELLLLVEAELTQLLSSPDMPSRIQFVIDPQPDSVDLLSTISSMAGVSSMGEHLENLIWGAISAELETDSSNRPFFAAHAARICSQLPQLISDYLELIKPCDEGKLSRVSPVVAAYVENEWDHGFGTVEAPATAQQLSKRAVQYDPFYEADAFRYIDGTFHKTELESVKNVDQFYGFGSIRERFKNYFDEFARGEKNQPLLISSLPGLGKTQFTISYVKSHDDLTLILPEPKALEQGLEKLVSQLSLRSDHRFVLFFDDIDAAKVDWFHFRTHVGGCFTLPENITIVVASNFEFPANISSRGVGVTYPMFDEVRCLEMIFDYLTDIGMKRPPNDLVSIIGADYVEEFALRNFEDLSPRTLARYLEAYDKSPEKRKRMLDMSRQKLVTKPDPQSFYDENLRLMKALYGEEGLRKMREHVLGETEF